MRWTSPAAISAPNQRRLRPGNLAVYVPNRAGLVISTTIKLRHASTVQFSNRYPEHIVCKTKRQAGVRGDGADAALADQGRHLLGDGRDTPSCFLLVRQGRQCRGWRPVRRHHRDGGRACHRRTGASPPSSTSPARSCTFENCHFWMTGQGDFQWNKQRATMMIANQDYWGLPSAYYHAVESVGLVLGADFSTIATFAAASATTRCSCSRGRSRTSPSSPVI